MAPNPVSRQLYNRVRLKPSIHTNSRCRLLIDCAKRKSLLKGRILHAQIVSHSQFETQDVYTLNNLLSMYAKCGDVADAKRVFDRMSVRDVVTWTAMITAYVKQGNYKEALELFKGMNGIRMLCQNPNKISIENADIKPNEFTYASILPSIAGLREIEEGRRIHNEIIRRNFEFDVFVASGLVIMYAKCGCLEDARQVFDKMSQRDVVLWNAMIEGYVCCGADKEALKLYYEMREAGLAPDEFTFASIMPACTEVEVLQQVHDEVRKRGFESNVVVGNAIVDMYGKTCSIDVARKVFDKMPERDVTSWNLMIRSYLENGLLNEALELFERMPKKDVVACNTLLAGYAQKGLLDEAKKLFDKMPKRDIFSWNAIIAACVKNGQDSEALALYEEMPVENQPNQFTFASILPACANLAALEHGKKIHEDIDRFGFHSDVFVGSALVDMYAKCKSVENARDVFDKIPWKDVVLWTSMIAGYAQNAHDEDALQLFQQMQLIGLEPDSETFAVVIPICANLAVLKQGKEVHGVVLKNGFQSNVYVASALVDMYAKCGSINDAHSIFDKMSDRGVVSWNAMIMGYAMHGFGIEALKLFDHMQHTALNPDHVTFLAVLSACCHAGLVDKGWHYFKCMNHDYQIRPTMQHYSCMVDLLGRAGQLVEAHDFINKMPIIPGANIWRCLLGACKLHDNVRLGELAAEHLFELDPENPAPYVLLSNIYAQAGRWEEIKSVRKLMKIRRLLKKPGCSWIYANKQVHAFLVGDG